MYISKSIIRKAESKGMTEDWFKGWVEMSFGSDAWENVEDDRIFCLRVKTACAEYFLKYVA